MREVFAASVLSISMQFFNALMLYLVVCWEVLCADRIGLFIACPVLLLHRASLAGNIIVLCIRSFSIKENSRLFFFMFRKASQ